MKKIVKIFSIITLTTISILLFAEAGSGNKQQCFCKSSANPEIQKNNGECKPINNSTTQIGSHCVTSSSVKNCYGTSCDSEAKINPQF